MKISTRYTEPAAPSGGPSEALSCAERHPGAAAEPVGVAADPVGVPGVAGSLAVVGAAAVVSGALAGRAVVELEQPASASASTLSAAMRCPDLITHRSTRVAYVLRQPNLITLW
ncbi:MAG TPA: hypothetical protein VFW21_08355, partial [Mycobacterium sp.]|nr:hypothetical protein [Mycobacterium sp.]